MSKKITEFIIPSIDLLDGKVVRLLKGDYDKATIYEVKLDDLLEKYSIFKKGKKDDTKNI